MAKTVSTKITTLKNYSITRSYSLLTALKIADLQRDAREDGISLGLELSREKGISIGIERGTYEKTFEIMCKLEGNE